VINLIFNDTIFTIEVAWRITIPAIIQYKLITYIIINAMKKKTKYHLTDSNQLTKQLTHRHLKFLMLLAMGLFWQSVINAQTPAPPLDSYVSFSGGQGSVFLILPDTASCSEIEVNLGSKTETGDLFTHAYVYDQESGLPSGLTYSRTDSDVTVGIGTVEVPPAYNVKIRLKNTAGNWSGWYEYITN